MAYRFRTGLVSCAALCASWSTPARAEYPLTADPVSIDFEEFGGAGFDPNPAAPSGQLDSDYWVVRGLGDGDLAFGGSENSGDFAEGLSPGPVANGGVYAWDTGAGNIALGASPSNGDFSPGSYVLRLQNQTGVAITSLELQWVIWTLNSGNESHSMVFSWSVDDSTYTAEPSEDYTSPVGADLGGWQSVERGLAISGFNLDVDEFIYLRWEIDEAAGSGSTDELGIDDIDFFVPGICGNGFTDAGEECDDANDVETDDCAECLDAVCGDGFIQAKVEMCDDGDMDNTDACPDGAGGTCEPAVCGDGFVFDGTEDCDDMNKVDDDECPNDCTIEGGSTTTGASTGDTTTTTSGGTTMGLEGSGGTADDGSSAGTTSTDPTTSTTSGDSGSADATASTTTAPPTTSTAGSGTSGDDTDPGVLGEEPPTCGCKSSSPAPGSLLFGLLALAGLRRRRR